MKLFYLLLFSIILTSCNITDKIESTGIKAISYGSGGGFTNEVKIYTILPDGAVWLHNSITNDSIFVKRIAKKEVNKVYGNALKLGLDTLSLSNPGNTYTFIGVAKDGTFNKVVWSSSHSRAPESIKLFYSKLREATNK